MGQKKYSFNITYKAHSTLSFITEFSLFKSKKFMRIDNIYIYINYLNENYRFMEDMRKYNHK